MPAREASRYARYMPHTIMSPWAKFTTRITPKISVRPTAMRLYTPPKSSPLTNPCRTSVRSTNHPEAGATGESTSYAGSDDGRDGVANPGWRARAAECNLSFESENTVWRAVKSRWAERLATHPAAIE